MHEALETKTKIDDFEVDYERKTEFDDIFEKAKNTSALVTQFTQPSNETIAT